MVGGAFQFRAQCRVQLMLCLNLIERKRNFHCGRIKFIGYECAITIADAVINDFSRGPETMRMAYPGNTGYIGRFRPPTQERMAECLHDETGQVSAC